MLYSSRGSRSASAVPKQNALVQRQQARAGPGHDAPAGNQPGSPAPLVHERRVDERGPLAADARLKTGACGREQPELRPGPSGDTHGAVSTPLRKLARRAPGRLEHVDDHREFHGHAAPPRRHEHGNDEFEHGDEHEREQHRYDQTRPDQPADADLRRIDGR